VAESIIIARKKEESKFDELEKSMTRFVAYFDPQGTWYTKNKGNEGAINNATLLTDASLSYLSNFYHRRAQKGGEKGDYQKAAHYYGEYIQRFPDTAAAFDMNFFLGEILLFDLNEYEKAAAQYQKVVDLYKNQKVPKDAKKEDVEAIVKDSAYAVVNAYNELVKKHHPESILVEMAKYDESQRAKQATNQKPESIETKPIPRTELLKYEKGFVEASDQYSEMYPKEDVTPTVDFVSAEVYKAHGQYDKCVPRYESIIQNAPKHRYASFAGNSLLEANYRLQRWDEVEKWGRHLLDNKIFDVTPKDKLEAAIVYSINEDAKVLKDEKNIDKAVERWTALANEFPDSQYAPGALFNAAAAWEAGDNIKKAVELYEKVVKNYSTSLQAPEAIFVMGAIYESRADFETAATYFERMGSTEKYKNEKGEELEYKDHANAADAVYNAAVIREAMADYDKAVATYEKYMELYPDRENVRDLGLHLAYIEKDKKDWKAAMKRFDEFAKRSDVKPAEVVEIDLERGLLHTEIKANRWEQQSDELFTKVVENWRKLEGEDKQKTKFYAAQARFLQAERVFKQFEAVKFEFPLKRLIKSMQDKGELEQKAEGMYTEVIEMGSPRWVAASAYRIGQMYKDFSDGLFALPLPKGLTEEQEFQYQDAIDEQAAPLQEKALTAFQAALRLALQYQAYNEWSSKSALEISKLDATTYPITGQDGVDAEHDRTNFSHTRPVLSLDVVKERVKARKAAAAPAAPPVEETATGEQAAR
jgi:cellulose synthase operon protein C